MALNTLRKVNLISHKEDLLLRSPNEAPSFCTVSYWFSFNGLFSIWQSAKRSLFLGLVILLNWASSLKTHSTCKVPWFLTRCQIKVLDQVPKIHLETDNCFHLFWQGILIRNMTLFQKNWSNLFNKSYKSNCRVLFNFTVSLKMSIV